MKKRIPDMLSVFRIFDALCILFATPLSCAFYILYILGGTSDISDGFIARRMNVRSKRGAALDSVADFVFCAVCFFKLYKYIFINNFIAAWIAIIFIVKCAAFFKNKNINHTILNKLTGFLLFISVPFLQSKYTVITLCAAASASAVGDVFINGP